jgi:hypothetical protein
VAAVPREPVVPVRAQALVLALLPPHAPGLRALAQSLVVRVVRVQRPQEPELAVLVRLPVPAELLLAVAAALLLAAAAAASAAVELLLSRQSSSAVMARSTT